MRITVVGAILIIAGAIVAVLVLRALFDEGNSGPQAGNGATSPDKPLRGKGLPSERRREFER